MRKLLLGLLIGVGITLTGTAFATFHGIFVNGGGMGVGSVPDGSLLYGSSTNVSLNVLATTTSGYVLTLFNNEPAWRPAGGGGATTTINSFNGPNFTFATSNSASLLQTITGSGSTLTWNLQPSAGYTIPLTASTTQWSNLYNNIFTTVGISTTSSSSTFYVTTSTPGNITINFPNNLLTSVTADSPLGGNGTSGSHLTCTSCLTANQTITLSGAVTGSGATSIATVFGAGDFATGTTGSYFNIATTTTSLTINLPNADSTHSGQLTATDWSTFNGKQAALSGGVPGKNTYWTSASALGVGALFDNGTVSGVNATSSTVSFLVQGTDILNPFNVASSSGTSELFVASNGNVGIGTTSPQGVLDIQGASTTTFIIRNGVNQPANGAGTDLVDIYNYGGGNIFKILSNGVIVPNGITVLGSPAAMSTTGWAMNSTYTVSWSNGSYYYNTNDIGLSRGAAGKLYVGNGTQGDYSGTLIAGNVGIGTTNPNFKLEVAGTASTTALNVVGNLNDATLTASSLVMSDANKNLQSVTLGSGLSFSGSTLNASNAFTGSGTNGYVAYWTSASAMASAASLLNNGTVAGVNATSSTVSLLVQGTTTLNPFQVNTSTGISILTINPNLTIAINTTTSNSVLFIQGTSTYPTLPLFTIASSSGTNILNVNPDGNLQIATTSANQVLITDGNNNVGSQSFLTSYFPTAYVGTDQGLTITTNQVYLMGSFALPWPITFSRFNYIVKTADATSTSYYDIGIYDNTGTLRAHTGTTTFSYYKGSLGTKSATTTATTTLYPGTYYMAYTGTSNFLKLGGTASACEAPSNVLNTGVASTNGVLPNTVSTFNGLSVSGHWSTGGICFEGGLSSN